MCIFPATKYLQTEGRRPAQKLTIWLWAGGSEVHLIKIARRYPPRL